MGTLSDGKEPCGTKTTAPLPQYPGHSTAELRVLAPANVYDSNPEDVCERNTPRSTRSGSYTEATMRVFQP